MPDTAARLALFARRNEVARFTFAVTGIDLTGVAMAMQVRLGRGVPGAPLIALATVNTLAAEGLKLDGVTVANGVPTSIIKGRINQATMSDPAKVPYAGELGADTVLAYAMQWTLGGDARTRIEGDLIVRDTAFGSDNAPANRPAGSGAAAAGGNSTGSLTFGDQVVQVSISDADLLAPLVAQASGAAGDAVAARQAVDARVLAAADVLPVRTAGRLTFGLTDALKRFFLLVTPTDFRHPFIDRIARFHRSGVEQRALGGGPEFALTDATNRRWFTVTPRALSHPTIDAHAARLADLEAGKTGDWREIAPTAERMGLAIYGASHSRGFASLPVISGAAQPWGLRFVGGVRPDDAGGNTAAQFGSTVALNETATSELGETVASGIAAMIAQLLAAEDGIAAATMNQQLLLSSSGQPGTPVTELADPASPYHQRLLAATQYGASTAATAGKTFASAGMAFPSGASDYAQGVSRETYVAKVRVLRLAAEAKARAESGLATRPYPIFLAQPAAHLHQGSAVPSIALAHLDLTADRYIGFACPSYIYPVGGDQLHFTALGSKWLGAQIGWFIKRWLWNGEKVAPLVPTVRASGARLLLRFPVRAGRRLVVDTATVPAQASWGFTAVDGAGAAVALSNPRLAGRDGIILDAASAPGAGFRLRYGWTGNGHVGLGNVRDDDPTVFDPGGLALPIRQWVPILEVTL